MILPRSQARSSGFRIEHEIDWGHLPRSFAPMLNIPTFHCARYSSVSSFCFFPTHLTRLGTRQCMMPICRALTRLVFMFSSLSSWITICIVSTLVLASLRSAWNPSYRLRHFKKCYLKRGLAMLFLKKKAVECQIGHVISIQINTEKSCAPDMGLEPMTLRLKKIFICLFLEHHSLTSRDSIN